MKLKKLSLIDLIFVLLLGLAVFFRFYHFEQTFEWGADNVRDFLVAKHIVKYHDFKWIAPWSFGSGNNLANSVFYYYFLAIFYILSFGQVIIYQLIFALFSFLVVGIYAYLIAKLFFREKVLRYITVLIFCFLPVFNVYGRSVFQPYFVLPFFMMSVYYLLASFKNKSNKDLSLAVIFYSLSINIHFSGLVALPWIFVMVFYLQYFINKKAKHFTCREFILSQFNWPLVIVCFNFYFLMINQFVIRNGVGNGLGSFSVFMEGIYRNLPFYFDNLGKNFSIFLENMFGFIGVSIFSIAILVLFIITLARFFLKEMTFYSLSIFASLYLFFCVFLIGYNNGNLRYPGYYFTPFYVLLPVFFLSVWSVCKWKWKFLAMSSFLFVIIFLSFIKFNKIKNISNLEQINKYQLIAKTIAEDAKKNDLESAGFIVFTIDDQLDWSSPIYWYYLENHLNRILVENSWYRYNTVAKVQESKNVYLICDDPRVSWGIGDEGLCLERFDRGNFLKEKKELLRINERNIAVYKLILNKAISPYAIYYESQNK